MATILECRRPHESLKKRAKNKELGGRCERVIACIHARDLADKRRACAILTVGSTGTLQNYNIPWGGLIKAGSAMKVLITRMQKVLSFPATMSSVSNQLLFLLCSYLVV